MEYRNIIKYIVLILLLMVVPSCLLFAKVTPAPPENLKGGSGERVAYMSDVKEGATANAEWGFFAIKSAGNALEDISDLKWSRMTGMYWRKLQQPPGSGNYNWDLMDKYVRKAQENNYNLVFVLKTGNFKKISDSQCFKVASRGGKNKYLNSCPIKKAYEDKWRNLVHNIIERYDGDGIDDMSGLKDSFRLDIQIENEAGSRNYWNINERKRGVAAARAYIRLLRISYEAKQSANPGTRIIISGMIHPNLLARCGKGEGISLCSSDYEKRNMEFTIEVLKHPQYFDALDIHFFNYFRFDPYYIRDGIIWFRDQMKKNGYEKPIYSLEWTGAMMLMVKREGHMSQFLEYFPYTGELKSRKELQKIYRHLNRPANRKYREWFDAEQAREFPKLFTTMLAYNVKRMIHVQFHDYFGKGWDNVWWNWQGIVRYEGTFSNPFLIKKPAYYNYNLLSRKLYGFDSVQILDYGERTFVYRFEFKGKKPVYIAWTENAPFSLDFSEYITSPQARVVHIVTELNSGNGPVFEDDEFFSPKAVPLTSTPVFVE